MNVTDGQAGLVRYSSLICYSPTINNILNIVILLILVGISLSAVKQTGLFEKVKEAKQKEKEAQKLENEIIEDYENKIGEYIVSNRENEKVVLTDKIKQNITITNMTGTTFKINVTSVEKNNSKILYYCIDNKLVYKGIENTYIATGLEENSKHTVIVLAEKNDMEVITGKGDNIKSWLACIGNTENITLDEIINNEQLLCSLMNSEEAVEYLTNSTEIILPQIMKSQVAFKIIANNENIMKKFCENEVFRKAMYDNYTITESILANSETAINAMKKSSRYEVVSNGNNIGGDESLYKELYNGKAFVIGISQDSFNKNTRQTSHGLYLNGDQILKTSAILTYGNTGLVYRVNKFASEVRQHPAPGANRTGYSYAAIFKI